MKVSGSEIARKSKYRCADLQEKAEEALSNECLVWMITYPSTLVFFESSVKDITKIIHQPWGTSIYGCANYELHKWD